MKGCKPAIRNSGFRNWQKIEVATAMQSLPTLLGFNSFLAVRFASTCQKWQRAHEKRTCRNDD